MGVLAIHIGIYKHLTESFKILTVDSNDGVSWGYIFFSPLRISKAAPNLLHFRRGGAPAGHLW